MTRVSNQVLLLLLPTSTYCWRQQTIEAKEKKRFDVQYTTVSYSPNVDDE
jgi:hypothetical protein